MDDPVFSPRSQGESQRSHPKQTDGAWVVGQGSGINNLCTYSADERMVKPERGTALWIKGDMRIAQDVPGTKIVVFSEVPFFLKYFLHSGDKYYGDTVVSGRRQIYGFRFGQPFGGDAGDIKVKISKDAGSTFKETDQDRVRIGAIFVATAVGDVTVPYIHVRYTWTQEVQWESFSESILYKEEGYFTCYADGTMEADGDIGKKMQAACTAAKIEPPPSSLVESLISARGRDRTKIAQEPEETGKRRIFRNIIQLGDNKHNIINLPVEEVLSLLSYSTDEGQLSTLTNKIHDLIANAERIGFDADDRPVKEFRYDGPLDIPGSGPGVSVGLSTSRENTVPLVLLAYVNGDNQNASNAAVLSNLGQDQTCFYLQSGNMVRLMDESISQDLASAFFRWSHVITTQNRSALRDVGEIKLVGHHGGKYLLSVQKSLPGEDIKKFHEIMARFNCTIVDAPLPNDVRNAINKTNGEHIVATANQSKSGGTVDWMLCIADSGLFHCILVDPDNHLNVGKYFLSGVKLIKGTMKITKKTHLGKTSEYVMSGYDAGENTFLFNQSLLDSVRPDGKPFLIKFSKD